MKHPFYSVLIVLCVSHAFDKFGVTSDSSASLGLGLGLGSGLDVGRYLDPSTNVGLGLVDDNTPWAKPGFVSDGLEARHIRSEQNITASETNDNVHNHSSELSELFAAGSGSAGNSSLTSTSRVNLVELEGGSSVTTDQIQTNVSGVFNLSLNRSNAARPRPTGTSSRPIGLGLLPTNSNTASIVPLEGGVLQEGLFHTSTTESGSLEVNLSTAPIKIDVKGGNDTRNELGLDLGLGLPTREGVSSLGNKQLGSQDSHITARKGANLSEQTESVNGTVVPLTFTSSEIDLDPNLNTQKITPRKGAELPKIFPRKGVDDQFTNSNSSDQFSSDSNNNTRTVVPVSTSTTTYSSRPTGNPTDIVKHINTSKAGRPSLLNDSMSTMKDMAEKSSTQSVHSKNSMLPTSTPAMEAVTTKTDSMSDVAVSNSNSTLNVKLPITDDIKNITLDKTMVDKSGIIASYPPLKKRPKPLKTTDIHSVNSSPITPEHSSSEHDYVIPIVVTILTVPMLVVLVLFLYKKGSEFWERRHYRRMDFLIDGMYND